MLCKSSNKPWLKAQWISVLALQLAHKECTGSGQPAVTVTKLAADQLLLYMYVSRTYTHVCGISVA